MIEHVIDWSEEERDKLNSLDKLVLKTIMVKGFSLDKRWWGYSHSTLHRSGGLELMIHDRIIAICDTFTISVIYNGDTLGQIADLRLREEIRLLSRKCIEKEMAILNEEERVKKEKEAARLDSVISDLYRKL